MERGLGEWMDEWIVLYKCDYKCTIHTEKDKINKRSGNCPQTLNLECSIGRKRWALLGLFTTIPASVDPDPDWIRIQSGPWIHIRIRIRNLPLKTTEQADPLRG